MEALREHVGKTEKLYKRSLAHKTTLQGYQKRFIRLATVFYNQPDNSLHKRAERALRLCSLHRSRGRQNIRLRLDIEG